MAYTQPTVLQFNGKAGTAIQLNAAKITGTGAQTPFQLPYPSGVYWSQVTIQAVVGSVTTLTVDLEADMTGVDANFSQFILKSADMFAAPIQGPLNLSAGNIRYRLNVKTFVDGGSTGVFFWAICG